jgi:hypothetical protein
MSRTSTFLNHFELAESPCGADVGSIAETDWVPAIVPGGVHESLMAIGRIEDPYRDENESAVRWIEERDWWFRGVFAGPTDLAADERVRLVFHGLDTVAEIWLNGERLGAHANMFRPAEYDVTRQLALSNEVLVRFSPPLAGLDVPPSVAETWAGCRACWATSARGPRTPRGSSPGPLLAPRCAARRRSRGAGTSARAFRPSASGDPSSCDGRRSPSSPGTMSVRMRSTWTAAPT